MKKRWLAILFALILSLGVIAPAFAGTFHRNYSASTLYHQYTFWASAFSNKVTWTNTLDHVQDCDAPTYQYAYKVDKNYVMNPRTKHPGVNPITRDTLGGANNGYQIGLTVYNILGGGINMPISGYYDATYSP